MKTCAECGAKNGNSSQVCDKCGESLITTTQDKATTDQGRQILDTMNRIVTRLDGINDKTYNNRNVTISDIGMPFGSMIVFMIKWAIASIPAMILLLVVGSVAVTILGGLLGTIFR